MIVVFANAFVWNGDFKYTIYNTYELNLFNKLILLLLNTQLCILTSRQNTNISKKI